MKRTVFGVGLVLTAALYNTNDTPTAQTSAIMVGPQTSIQEARAWTIEEMRAAVEYPMPTIAGPSPRDVTGEQPAGEPFRAPGGGPDFDPSIEPMVEPEPLNRFLAPAYVYPPPFTNYRDSYRSKLFPEKTTGVMFFTQHGQGFRCSASSIGNYGIYTAGHCVHSGNNSNTGFSTNITFVPGYDATKANPAPYGQWTGAYVWVHSDWFANGNPNGFDNDLGAVILHKDANGRKISKRVGWLGFASDQGYIRHWHGMGYPAAAPFNGATLQNCASSYAFMDDLNGAASPNTVGRGCNHTGGTSGGPWVLFYQVNVSGANNYLNGVMSYKYTGETQSVYSPYFAANARALYDCAVNSSPSTGDCTAPPQP